MPLFQKRQRFYRYVLRRRWFQLRGRDAILRDADEGTKWRDWCRFWGTAKGWSFFLPEMARLGEIWTNKNVPWTSNSGFKMFRRWCCNFFSGDDSLNLIMAETYWQLSQVWKWQTCFFPVPRYTHTIYRVGPPLCQAVSLRVVVQNGPGTTLRPLDFGSTVIDYPLVV